MTRLQKLKGSLTIGALFLALIGGYFLGSARKPAHPPAVGEKSAAAPAATDKKSLWVSPMDPTYVRDAPGKDYMGHDLVPLSEEQAGGGITIDPVTIQNMGLRTAPVERRSLARTVRTVGLVTVEEGRQYSINSKIEGWIERLHIDQTGQVVRKGQPLAEIYSPDLVAAQQEYLLALDGSRRLAQNPFPEIAAGADRLLEAARTRLAYWDISAAQIKELERRRQPRKTMTLYSPYSGVVIMKRAVAGMRIMAGEELLQITDLSRVWIIAEIYEQELPWVRVGQAAQVEIPALPNQPLSGKIAYIYPLVQGESRTVKARIELANPGLALKPEMYANIRISGTPQEAALTVPDSAVLRSGTKATVFVAKGEGRFEPREVQAGVSDDEGHLQILAGLSEGEQVVVSAQFLLDSESRLREAVRKMMAPTPAKKEENLEELFK